MKEASRLLRRFLDRVGDEEERILIVLRELWPNIVGTELARHTSPESLSEGVLIIRVPSGVWRTELLRVRPEILRATNEFWRRSIVSRIEFQESDQQPSQQ